MAVALAAQTAIDEQELDDAQLLLALNNRQQHKEAVKQARKTYKEADDRAKALIANHELADDTAARIGQYRISKKAVPARSVQFETDPSSRITISLIHE